LGAFWSYLKWRQRFVVTARVVSRQISNLTSHETAKSDSFGQMCKLSFKTGEILNLDFVLFFLRRQNDSFMWHILNYTNSVCTLQYHPCMFPNQKVLNA
jgi:hypothetical protein